MNFNLFKPAISITLMFVLFASTEQVKAQFTYGGVKLSYHNVRFDKGEAGEGTRINNFVANIDLVHRPRRYFALGTSIRIPVVNGFKYQFVIDEGGFTSNINGGGTFSEDVVEFAGGDFHYNIESTLSLTFLGRIYFETETNIYLDLRYTIEKYDETFNYSRNGSQSLPNKNIAHQESLSTNGFGLSLGYHPRISDHFYMGYAFTVDFLGTDDVSFEEEIITEINSNGDKNSTLIRSKIDDSQTIYELSVSFGFIL